MSEEHKIIPTAELGSTGLRRFGGDITEEFLRELQGNKATKVYKEMADNDTTIGAILFVIQMLIRNVNWTVEPESSDPADQMAAEFLEECMNDMSVSWTDTIAETLSMLQYGWAYHEIVYKFRNGPNNPDPAQRSRFNDGRLGWRKLPIRSQDTLDKWEFSEDGGLQGMHQLPPPDYRRRYIPIEKGLLFRPSSHKQNPEGKSILRNAYRAWYIKKHIENIEAIGIERDLAGIPVIGVPPELLDANATTEERAALEEYKRIVTNIKRDEQEGIVFPLAYDNNNNKMYEISLLTSGGSRNFNTTEIINRYDQRIAMSVLADFIMLGQNSVGSFALSSDKTDMFASALGAWLKSIQDVFNRIAIPRLFGINSFRVDKLPTIQHGDIETADLQQLGTYITQLAGAGVSLFPDQELENHLKRQGGLPVTELHGKPSSGLVVKPPKIATQGKPM